MAESTVFYTPENSGGFLGGNNGLGGGILGFLLGLWLGNGNGYGPFGGGGNNASASAQREMLNTAVLSQGEASRAAIQNLATSLGQDFTLVNSAVQTIQSSLSSLALQQAVSVPQIINSVQSGNAALASQLCQCCCENRLLTTEQGYQAQLRTVEQTGALTSQAERNTRAITDAISAQSVMIDKGFCDIKERELQSKVDTQAEIITQLRGQIDNAQQTAAITGYINSLVSPIAKEVDDIKCKLPNTVAVQYPNLYAVNATPYVSGGFYQGGFNGYYGGGVPGFGGITF